MVKHYCMHLTGQWVFRLSCKKDDIVKQRLFIVEKRDRVTTLP